MKFRNILRQNDMIGARFYDIDSCAIFWFEGKNEKGIVCCQTRLKYSSFRVGLNIHIEWYHFWIHSFIGSFFQTLIYILNIQVEPKEKNKSTHTFVYIVSMWYVRRLFDRFIQAYQQFWTCRCSQTHAHTHWISMEYRIVCRDMKQIGTR